MKNIHKKIKTITRGSLKEMGIILPIFFIAVLIGTIMELYIPTDFISNLVNKNLYFAIPLAALIGVLLPIPRYATYPIAFALFIKGAGFGIVFALISGEVICESLARDLIEIKYLGLKFFSTRLILSLIFIIAGAFIIEILL